jgi:hypothetical protein
MSMNIPKRAILFVAMGFAAGGITDRLLVRDTTVVHAQRQRTSVLIIGGESVSVGMPRDSVVVKFAEKYDILPAGGGSESLFVLEKNSTKGNSGDAVGVLNFVRGKLVSAERDWGSFYSKDGIDGLWTSLDGALSQQLELNNWSTVQIRRTQVETPQMGLRTIAIRFPERTIQLQKGRSEGAAAGAPGAHVETYSVSEIIPFHCCELGHLESVATASGGCESCPLRGSVRHRPSSLRKQPFRNLVNANGPVAGDIPQNCPQGSERQSPLTWNGRMMLSHFVRSEPQMASNLSGFAVAQPRQRSCQIVA